ncbi:hypothetical protein E2C01_070857 [Portunus trituberculatus]|uniref:Uncharacterized protein n=1 Tax=Portunus trituberculatus TaxID=210409 RepID=A0A5B7I3C4_PORTR|nr:hypothetical protein [Portunus trituberculatus]
MGMLNILLGQCKVSECQTPPRPELDGHLIRLGVRCSGAHPALIETLAGLAAAGQQTVTLTFLLTSPSLPCYVT